MPLRHMVAASVIRAYAQHAATSSSPDLDPEDEGPYPAALVHPAMGLVWVALLLVFLAMTAIVCDHYMVPTLVKTCDHFGIPEEAAGSTVFAFASAAMDIFFSLIETAMGEPGIGLSYVEGTLPGRLLLLLRLRRPFTSTATLLLLLLLLLLLY